MGYHRGYNKSEFFECICACDEHILRFSLDIHDPDDATLDVSVFLNQYHGPLCRLWLAIKYVLGWKCKYGHWDSTMIKPEDADRLISLAQAFKTAIERKGHDDGSIQPV